MTFIWEWKLDNLTKQRAKDSTLLLLYDRIQEANNKMCYKWFSWYWMWLKGTWQKLDVSNCVLPALRHFSSIFHSSEFRMVSTLKPQIEATWCIQKNEVQRLKNIYTLLYFFQLVLRHQYCPQFQAKREESSPDTTCQESLPLNE